MQIWGKKWSLNNKILGQKCGLWSLKTGGLLMQVKIIVITLGRIWKWSLNTGGVLIEVVFRSSLTVYGVYTLYRQLLLQFLANPFETLQLFSGWSEDMHIVFSGSWNYFFLHFNLDIFSSLYATDMYREYMPCIGNPAYSFRPILLKLYRYFAAFLWFHMRNLSLAGYNCSGGASCMACSFIVVVVVNLSIWIFSYMLLKQELIFLFVFMRLQGVPKKNRAPFHTASVFSVFLQT